MSEMLSFELGPSWTVDSWYGPALWQRGRPSGCSSDRNDRVHLVKRSIKSVQWNPLNESPEYLDNKNVQEKPNRAVLVSMQTLYYGAFRSN